MQYPTDILTERMEQKLELLVQLRDLGLHQQALIRSGDMTQLLKLLAAKQRLLLALQSLERALDPFRDETPESRIWQSPAHRLRCAELASQCEALLRAIVEQERQSETQMTLRRDEAAARLEGAHFAREVHRAYGSDSLNRPGQLDLSQG